MALFVLSPFKANQENNYWASLSRTFPNLLCQQWIIFQKSNVICSISKVSPAERCKKSKNIFPSALITRASKCIFHCLINHASQPIKKRNSCCILWCKLVISHTAVQNLVSSRRTKDESKRETCPFNNRRRRFVLRQHSLNLRIPKLSAYMESFTVWCAQMKWVPISECALSGGFIWLTGERCESQQQKLPCVEWIEKFVHGNIDAERIN